MREGWEEVALADVSDRMVGPAFTSKDFTTNEEDIRLVRGSNVAPGALSWTDTKRWPAARLEGFERYLLKAGDVLVAMDGSITNAGLKSAVVRDADLPALLVQRVTRVRANASVLQSFLAVVLTSDLFRAHVESIGTQSVIPHISGGDIGRFRFLLPPLQEQRRIVDLVSALDGAISAAGAGTPLPAYHQMLEAWMSKPGRPLSDAVRRSEESVAVAPHATYRILGLLRSGEGFIDRGEVAGDSIAYSRMYAVRPDQLVYRKLTAWEGPISVSTDAEDGGWVSGEFPVFDIDPKILLPDLLRHVCRWPGLWHRISHLLVGSVHRRKRLNPGDLVRIEVPMPSLEEQRTACDVLDGLWVAATSLSAATDRLHALRSSLLTVLLSGEHEIPESYDELLEAV